MCYTKFLWKHDSFFSCTSFLMHALHYVKNFHIRSYSGPYFPAFGLNTEKYGVSLCTHSECGKIRTRITPNTDTFYAVLYYHFVFNVHCSTKFLIISTSFDFFYHVYNLRIKVTLSNTRFPLNFFSRKNCRNQYQNSWESWKNWSKIKWVISHFPKIKTVVT